jgi:ribosomal protein L7/L12
MPENVVLYDVYLVETGPNRVEVIRRLVHITKKGLAESKRLSDNVPSLILSNVPAKLAKSVKLQLESIQAAVELQQQ